MSRSFWIVAGLLVVSVFIITTIRDTGEALPIKSTELTEKASVPDGENIKLISEQSPYMRTER
jgi:hypothetical protein